MSQPILVNLDLSGNQLLNAALQNLSSDPGTPVNGQVWFNTTSKTVKFYDGTAVQTLADLSAVVNSLSNAGGDTTITIGGTATAPTIKVAKALDHTYVTDFVATVEAVRLDQMAAPTATVSMGNQTLSNVADAVNPKDAVNLETLLSQLAGISSRDEVAYASSSALAANTYANGSSGVGATLTGNANGALSMDSEAPAVGMRVLVAGEATTSHNGIYTVTQAGDGTHPYILTRAIDFNSAANVVAGALIPVEAPTGSTPGVGNNGKVFLSITASPAVLGTSAITFSNVGGTYTADGTTITLTGNQFSLTIPVAIASGGTGATSASGARTNLSSTSNPLPQKFAASVGNGSSTSITVNHNLGTTDVEVQVWEVAGSKRLVVCDTSITDSNNIVVAFAVAPTTNQYRVVVTG